MICYFFGDFCPLLISLCLVCASLLGLSLSLGLLFGSLLSCQCLALLSCPPSVFLGFCPSCRVWRSFVLSAAFLLCLGLSCPVLVSLVLSCPLLSCYKNGRLHDLPTPRLPHPERMQTKRDQERTTKPSSLQTVPNESAEVLC